MWVQQLQKMERKSQPSGSLHIFKTLDPYCSWMMRTFEDNPKSRVPRWYLEVRSISQSDPLRTFAGSSCGDLGASSGTAGCESLGSNLVGALLVGVPSLKFKTAWLQKTGMATWQGSSAAVFDPKNNRTLHMSCKKRFL